MQEQLLQELRSSLLRYWLKCGIPMEVAEDLAQEGVLKAIRTMDKWTGKNGASPKTFATQVAKNAGRDYLRKDGKHSKRCVPLEEEVTKERGGIEPTPDDES